MPAITTRVGYVGVADSANGRVLIAIENLVNPPTVFGEIVQGTLPTDMSADTYYTINGYNKEVGLGMITDKAAGSIECEYSGRYSLSASIAMVFDAVSGTSDVFLELRDTSGVQSEEIQEVIIRNSEASRFYPKFTFNATAGTKYELRIKCSRALSGVSLTLSNFLLESLHLTEAINIWGD
jgi:hypothetical protein